MMIELSVIPEEGSAFYLILTSLKAQKDVIAHNQT